MKISEIARGFDLRAAHYDNPLTAFIGEKELRQIRTLIPEYSRVLDFGCGTGRTTLDLLMRSCTVTAYDISANMLAAAQSKSKRLGLQAEFVTDIQQLTGRTWPVITCIGVLDYYPDPVPILRTIRDFMEPEGLLIVTYPNALSPCGWLYMLGSRFTVPATPHSPAFVRRSAKQAGLQTVKTLYAFPAVPLLGYTIVQALSR
jgi:2-polyprenyl-3-methyl-5-hydroxy-6-metoxy-1,4-benzoquinol methylase